MSKRKSSSSSARPAVVEARPSASLVLLSPLPPSKLTPDGFEYRVCLLKRNSTMAMAPSATVFPGGNLSEADTAVAKTLKHDVESGKDTTEIALKICALRETFEETGILVRRSYENIQDITKEEYAAARKKVYANAAEFLPFYQSTSNDKQESLPLELLSYWNNWITPTNQPKRFDTRFYLHILQRNESSTSSPLLTADGGETMSAEWITPQEALTQCLVEHKTILFPPQAWVLAELARRPTLSAVRRFSQERSGNVKTYLPSTKRVKGRTDVLTFVLPGDCEHDEPGPPGTLHRSYILAEGRPGEGKGMRPKQPLALVGLCRKGLQGMEDMEEGMIVNIDAASMKSKARL